MKKCCLFSSILMILAFGMTPIMNAQQPLASDLTGVWEVTIVNANLDWGETSTNREVFTATIMITHIDGFLLSTEPNLIVDLPDTDDDFVGFTHDNMFAFYKENSDNCGGPDVNFGREMIVGTVNKKGNKMAGDGVGFDSNPGCGGTWTYFFAAKKVSDEIPFD